MDNFNTLHYKKILRFPKFGFRVEIITFKESKYHSSGKQLVSRADIYLEDMHMLYADAAHQWFPSNILALHAKASCLDLPLIGVRLVKHETDHDNARAVRYYALTKLAKRLEDSRVPITQNYSVNYPKEIIDALLASRPKKLNFPIPQETN